MSQADQSLCHEVAAVVKKQGVSSNLVQQLQALDLFAPIHNTRGYQPMDARMCIDWSSASTGESSRIYLYLHSDWVKNK